VVTLPWLSTSSLTVDAAEVGRIEADLEMVPAGGSLCGDLDGEAGQRHGYCGVWACACAATAVAAVALTGVDVVVAGAATPRFCTASTLALTALAASATIERARARRLW